MSENLRERAIQLAARSYLRVVLRDDTLSEEPLYVALNPELDGCMAQGETVEEAENYLDEFRVDYIEHLLKNDLPVPDPTTVTTMTGSPTFGKTKWQFEKLGSESNLDEVEEEPSPTASEPLYLDFDSRKIMDNL
jgi:predicted RNase H-like HicB family nuclease